MAQCSAGLPPYTGTFSASASHPRREDSLLLLDFASPTQALTKVRVRIANLMFVDYLTWHRIDDKWLITSKGFHLEAA